MFTLNMRVRSVIRNEAQPGRAQVILYPQAKDGSGDMTLNIPDASMDGIAPGINVTINVTPEAAPTATN